MFLCFNFACWCKAVLAGITLASDMSLPRVVVTSYIQSICHLLSRGSCRIYLILNKIRRLNVRFDEIHWEWSPREANRAAHVAASLATRAMDLKFLTDGL